MLRSWYETKKDVRHFQLIERHSFDANSLNPNYVNEMDDRSGGGGDSIYDIPRVDWLVATPMTQPSLTPSFSLSESSPHSRSRSNTWNNSTTAQQQQQQQVKLYRRINDSSRNLTRFQASLAQIFMPFHINTALVRYPAFVNANKFTLNDYFDQKTAQQLQLIKAVAKRKFNFFFFFF